MISNPLDEFLSRFDAKSAVVGIVGLLLGVMVNETPSVVAVAVVDRVVIATDHDSFDIDTGGRYYIPRFNVVPS